MRQHNQQGSGKHPHKSSDEPSHHMKGAGHGGEHGSSGKSASGMSSGPESADLKSRGHRESNVHHHTAKDERSRH